jgi:hypothetical protein
MIYSLEILKARHLRVLGLGREVDADVVEVGEPTRRAVSGARR